MNYDILIIGGGAAGFFSAINIADKNPNLRIAILERGKECLQKVKVSGGGRCNVTHACFIPNDLVKFYPRGEKELKGPFHQFCSGDTIEWFEKKGIELKIEEDGRMFPITDSSQTIIDCFYREVKRLKIEVLTSQSVQDVYFNGEFWKIETQNKQYVTQKLIVATGSNPKIWELFQDKGHQIIPPVPSLFTFNIKDSRLHELMGVSVDKVTVSVQKSKLEASGPILITHWGLSGPAILRLSAWGAREFATSNYIFKINVNWLDELNFEACLEKLIEEKVINQKKNMGKYSLFSLSKRLWESLLVASGIPIEKKWSDVSKKELVTLCNQLTNSEFQVNGKSTFKEEFVTAGGVDLREINFKNMQSKVLPNLYFVGEVLNIDAITGGFNFQNAWTTGFIVSENILIDLNFTQK